MSILFLSIDNSDESGLAFGRMTAEEKAAAIVSEHMSAIGTKGGRVMSRDKRAAIMKNLAKTRTHKKAAKNNAK